MLRRRLDRGAAPPSARQVVDADACWRCGSRWNRSACTTMCCATWCRWRPAPGAIRQVAVGASPRAELDLIQLARARALLLGRDYVIPEDVKALATPAVAHRISCGRRCGCGASAVDVVEELLRRLPVPRPDRPGRTRRRRPQTCPTSAIVRWRASPLTHALAPSARRWPCAGGGRVVLAIDRLRRAAARRAVLAGLAAPGAAAAGARGAGRAALLRIRTGRIVGAGVRPAWCGGTEVARRRPTLHARSTPRDGDDGIGGAVGPVRTGLTVTAVGGGLLTGPPRFPSRSCGCSRWRRRSRLRSPRHTSGPHRRPPHPPIRFGRRVRGHPRLRAGRPAAERQLAGECPARPAARHRPDHGPRRGRRGAVRHHPAGTGPGVGCLHRPCAGRRRWCRRPCSAATGRGRRPRCPAAMARRRHRARQFYRILDTVLDSGDGFETTNGTLAPAGGVAAGPWSSRSPPCWTPTSRCRCWS